MYLKKLLAIIVIVWAAAYATGKVLDHIYKKRWSILFFKKTDTLLKDSSNYDIIYLGNSRVHFGINPYYVDSVTGLSSYNLGFGGADITEISMVGNVYLEHHPAPKMLILSLDMSALSKNESLKKSGFHYLYYLNDDTLGKYMKQAGFLTGMMKWLPFTKYCFFDEYNRTSLFIKGTKTPVFGHNIYRGFLNILQDLNNQAVVFSRQPADKLWDTAITYLRNTVSAFQRKGTIVVFVAPPERRTSAYKAAPLRKTTDSIFSAIAGEYHLRYFHFENAADIYKDDYFKDDIHLKEPATQIYSKQLADSIKTIYPYNK